MVYRMIDDLEKKCGRLSGAAISHRGLITNTLADRWAHKLPDGQTVPDIYQLQTYISEDLDELNQEVLRVERELRNELTDDREQREVRDRSRNRMREHMFSARKIFDAIYGPGGSDVMFQEQGSFVRTDPVPLYRQGVALHDNLLDPDFHRPPLRLDVGVDLEKLARGLEPDLEALGAALKELHRGTQDSIELFAAKDRDMERLDRKIGVSARLLESLYAYADQQGIAIRVRQSSHRSGRSGAGGAAPADAVPGAPESADASAVPDAGQAGEDRVDARRLEAPPGEPASPPSAAAPAVAESPPASRAAPVDAESPPASRAAPVDAESPPASGAAPADAESPPAVAESPPPGQAGS